MKRIQCSLALALALAVALLGLGLMPTVQPAVAQSSGTTITSAVLSVYQQYSPNLGEPTPATTVRVHRITAPWAELDVNWTNFAGAFDPTVITSLQADSTGWHTATVTSLVQSWVDNPSQNYGLLLEQGATLYNNYTSSEGAPATNLPKLDVCYTRNAGPETCFTIQRGVGLSQVNDAYIWSGVPDYNGGDIEVLYTGLFTNAQGSGEKYSLLRFEMRTPTAVQLQSLSARSSVSPELALAAVGMVSVAGVAVLRRRIR
jgi:hypothetical protein